MEKAVEKNNSFIKVAIFLLMEIMAILSFSLGNNFIFYAILMLLITGVISFISYKEFSKDGFSTFFFFLFPLLVYGFLTALSHFTEDPAYVLGSNKIVNLIIAFGLTGFAVSGYLFSTHQEIKISQVLLVIYGALAIYVLINLFATMVEFEPFYTVKYRNYYIYYDGVMNETPVGSMAFALMGFSFEEVSVQYFTFFANILLSSSLGLFFIKYKENKKTFLAFCAFTALAVISIILTINKYCLLFTLLEVVTLAIIICLIKFKVIRPYAKYVFIGVGVLAGLFFLVMVLNAQYYWGSPISFVRNTIAKNSFLSHIFNDNRFAKSINAVLDGIFSKEKMFGNYTVEALYITHVGYDQGLYPVGSWLVDNFMISGLFGSLFFIFLLVVGLRRVILYFKNSEDNLMSKTLITALVFSIFVYGLVGFDANPYVFKSTLIPFCQNGLFLIAIFLISYCFCRSLKQVEKKEEAIVEEGGNDDEKTLEI